jgi:hypothetical protein
MNPAQSITFMLVITYLITHGLYGVNVKGRHFRVFHPKNNHNKTAGAFELRGLSSKSYFFSVRSLIISISFLSLAFIHSIGLVTSQ